MTRVADALFYFLKIVAALCLATAVVLVFTNVVLRYAFNEGISVSEELSTWLLTWITYIAGLVAVRDRGHLGFDTLVTHLPPIAQRVCLAVAQLLMMAVTALFFRGAWLQTAINIDNHAPASGLSQGWLYGIGLVFSSVSFLVLLVDFFNTVTGRIAGHELVMVESEGGEALVEVDEQALARDRAEITASTNRAG